MTYEDPTTPPTKTNTPANGTPRTLAELHETRWGALVKLSEVVQAYEALYGAGFAPHHGPVDSLEDWLENHELKYVTAYQRWQGLLNSGFDVEEEELKTEVLEEEEDHAAT